jgi:putative DNA primase/helicase
MVAWSDLNLADAHVDMLVGAGITPQLAKRRGYWTAYQTDVSKLRNVLGFADWQTPRAAFPALVLPMFPPGESTRTPATAQIRPAVPRPKGKGKDGPKYETPAKAANRLDVHPANAKHLGDPSRRLWITEGVKKADALAAQGEIAVAITGVWNWRGRTLDNGSTALGDFEAIALKGREAFVAFDSDAVANPHVRGAMVRLVGLLRARGATALFIVVPGSPESKRGVDDYLSAGGTVRELLELAVDSITSPTLYQPIIDLAREFCERMEHQHLYVPEWERWLVWNGQRWVEDVLSLRTEQAGIRFIEELVAAIKDPVRRARARYDISVGRARNLMSNTVRMHREELTVTVDELDAHPLLLNTQSGIVDLRTGELGAHDPSKLMTKITAGAYRSGIVSPDVRAVTTETVRPDAVEWLQKFFGYASRGTVTQELFVVLQGEGANGKTTLLEGIGAAMGDYADAVPSKLMTRRGLDEHATIEADLFGMRICWASETEEGSVLAIERIKSLTGGDKRKARRMRQDYWSFIPSHTLMLATNHRPNVPAGDWGTWRRLKLVTFPYRFTDIVELPDDRPGDDGLRDRLKTVQVCLDAMVTWIVEGSVMYERDGLRPFPDSVSVDTLDWRRSSDLMLAFTDDRTTWDEAGRIPRVEFAEQFNEYLTELRRPTWATSTIIEQLISTGRQAGRSITVTKSMGAHFLRGVRWATDAEKAARDDDARLGRARIEPEPEADREGSAPYRDVVDRINDGLDSDDDQG